MIILKHTYNHHNQTKTPTKYSCDMCKTIIEKPDKITVYTSKIGETKPIKKFDLCKRCMRIIEKNVDLWYDRIIKKNS